MPLHSVKTGGWSVVSMQWITSLIFFSANCELRLICKQYIESLLQAVDSWRKMLNIFSRIMLHHILLTVPWMLYLTCSWTEWPAKDSGLLDPPFLVTVVFVSWREESIRINLPWLKISSMKLYALWGMPVNRRRSLNRLYYKL